MNDRRKDLEDAWRTKAFACIKSQARFGTLTETLFQDPDEAARKIRAAYTKRPRLTKALLRLHPAAIAKTKDPIAMGRNSFELAGLISTWAQERADFKEAQREYGLYLKVFEPEKSADKTDQVHKVAHALDDEPEADRDR